ncbi:MAG: hypothetical protein Q8L06_06195, partial [Pseudohongiella sp.]|nr:hypothetical protein [Pseudohongiella sp.]
MKYFVPAIFRGWCIASGLFAVLLFPSLVLANGPDLSVSKSCVIASPQTIKCDVVVTNIGTVPTLPQFTITDTVTATPVVNYLSVGGSLVTSCSPGPQQINNVNIVCSVTGSLAVGASGTAIFDFSMPTGGEFQNCASTTLPVNPMAPPDSNSLNNTNICTTLTVDPPTPSPAAQDLSTDKVCAVNGAQSILCTITVTNVGGTASSNPFTLSDVVTANNTVNLTGAGGTLNPSCSPGAQVINNVPINCTINSSLAPNASGTILLSFTMPQGGQFE